MGRAQSMRGAGDGEMLARLREGDDGAWEDFLRRWGALLLSIVGRLAERAEVEAAFIDLARRLRAGNCACLADWKPGLEFRSYLTFKAIDLMSADLIRLLSRDGPAGWKAFEHFFGPEIERLSAERARRVSLGADEALDLAQDVRLRLMEERAAAIRRHDGRGSLSGFVRVASRNLLEDLVRERLGRRREPEPVQRLDPLARELYRLLHVGGHRVDQLPDLVRDVAGRPLPEQSLKAALQRLDAALPAHAPLPGRPHAVGLTVADEDGGERERPLPLTVSSPEDIVLSGEERRRHDSILDALAEAMAVLPGDARTYLEHRFLADPPLPPRRIAERMGLPVETLYRLRGRWEDELRAELRRRGVEKFAAPSVP